MRTKVTERKVCPLCGESTTFTYTTSHADSSSGMTYDLFQCVNCTGQFFEPLKNPGASWYEHDVRYAGRNQDPILEAQWNHKKTIDFFFPKTGSVLDVGCGVGNFLGYAESKGWKGVGIDFDNDAVNAGKKTFGLTDLSVQDIHQFKETNQGKQFDLVTFFDVLEHIDDHDRFMNAVRALVKDGGSIAMSMPHRAHASFLMPADVPPRHLTRWDETSLTKFLLHHGFEVMFMKPKGEGVRFIILKLRFRFGRHFSMGLVNRARGGSSGVERKNGAKVVLAKILALVKDTMLFGVPALILWVMLLPSRKRYISLYAIARKRS